MQPPNMLTPLSFWSFMISAFISLRLGSVALYFLYFSLMASICGWMRCIFRPFCMVLMRKGSMRMLMRTVRMMMAQPQLETTWAWMNWRARKRYLPMAPQKPKSSSGSRVTLRVGGVDGS